MNNDIISRKEIPEHYNRLPSLGIEKSLEEMKNARPAFLKDDGWYDEDTSSLYLDFSLPYRPPRWTLSYAGKEFAMLGEISMITGQAGSGKSNFLAMVMAAVLQGSCGSLKYELSDDIPHPRVLYIDTEMGLSDTISQKNRVCTLAGIDYSQPQEQFRVARLRDTVAAEQRFRQTLKLINEQKPTVCILDGLIDLIDDPNDVAGSTHLIRKLMAAATFYDMSLWLVLHQNPNPNSELSKMVGWLGSTAERKAAEVLRVKRVKDPKPGYPPIYFDIKPQKMRNGEFIEDWDFEIVTHAKGWGMPREIKTTPVQPYAAEDVQKWLADGWGKISWPATEAQIFDSVFAPQGVPKNRKQEVLAIAQNRRFIVKDPNTKFKNDRYNLQNDLIAPF